MKVFTTSIAGLFFLFQGILVASTKVSKESILEEFGIEADRKIKVELDIDTLEYHEEFDLELMGSDCKAPFGMSDKGTHPMTRCNGVSVNSEGCHFRGITKLTCLKDGKRPSRKRLDGRRKNGKNEHSRLLLLRELVGIRNTWACWIRARMASGRITQFYIPMTSEKIIDGTPALRFEAEVAGETVSIKIQFPENHGFIDEDMSDDYYMSEESSNSPEDSKTRGLTLKLVESKPVDSVMMKTTTLTRGAAFRDLKGLVLEMKTKGAKPAKTEETSSNSESSDGITNISRCAKPVNKSIEGPRFFDSMMKDKLVLDNSDFEEAIKEVMETCSSAKKALGANCH